jgi:glyoxylase-like metal-dependent hydrolase (beta-lactamase superfamily II)
MSLLVKRIPNKPIDSNCFVVYSTYNESCLIIDPGTEDCADLIRFIDMSNLKPDYILLTHEHFDHIWGVNKLRDIYAIKLICLRDCSAMIADKKKNMSLFYDQVGFETCHADILLEDIDKQMKWNGTNIEFISTKGHTEASICIHIDNYLFTGDTIIRNHKTVVKLPGGDKNKLEKSFSILNQRFFDRQIQIHSGHGESFWYDEIKNQKLI